jgi:hypothetical protein
MVKVVTAVGTAVPGFAAFGQLVMFYSDGGRHAGIPNFLLEGRHR